MKISKHIIMREANRLHWQEGITQSEAVRKAWIFARIVAAHNEGLTVRIAFIKKNGDYRPMFASPSRFGAYTCKGGYSNVPKTNYLVWDAVKNEFRQFCIARLVAWNGIATAEEISKAREVA